MTDEEFEREQALRFRKRLAADLARLRALAPADLAALERLAHGLAGAGGTFGFAAVSERAEAVERLAEVGARDDLPAAIAALEATLLAALAA